MIYKFHESPLPGVVSRLTAFQPGGPGSVPGGVRNFQFYPGTWCVSFVLCPVLFWRWQTFCWPLISGRSTPVYLSSVLVQSLCSSYRHLTHGYLGFKSRRCKFERKINLMNGQYLFRWQGNHEKNFSQVGRHQDLSSGTSEHEFRVIPLRHLTRVN